MPNLAILRNFVAPPPRWRSGVVAVCHAIVESAGNLIRNLTEACGNMTRNLDEPGGNLARIVTEAGGDFSAGEDCT